jgi:hypothetical protein
MNADSHHLLVLVREFDDRFGWKKWQFKCCAQWLAWRASISMSAAREKARTAHALRALPLIDAAFAAGRLSYSKARALTRVAHVHYEELLLEYALDATVPQLEERCRQIRNVAPESAHRKQSTTSTPLKRALHARDRGCTFPGCHRKRYPDATAIGPRISPTTTWATTTAIPHVRCRRPLKPRAWR